MDATSFESVDIDYTLENLVESDNFLTEEEDYFLQQLEAIGVKEVFPNFTYLGVEYDSLRPIKDFYTEEEMHLLLESLAKKGYLKEFNLGTVLLCPECNSPVVMITLICGDCGSTKVKKVDVIEHLECGYQGEESQFLTGKTMTCPLCGESLENHNTGKKYRVVNSKYYCDSCGNVIDKARTVLHCLKCKNKFKHGEAIRRNPKGYVVDDYNHDRELRDNYLVDVTDDENPATEIETHLIEPDNEAHSTNKQEKKEKVDDGKKRNI
jgi:ribosomal protein S27AE